MGKRGMVHGGVMQGGSVNARRGEVGAVLDGQSCTLVLTLGALAELESAFGVEDLMALAERFGRGRLSARDAARIILAGLRGAGADVTLDDVERMRADGGAAGFAQIVSALLGATFGTSGEEPASPPQLPQEARA